MKFDLSAAQQTAQAVAQGTESKEEKAQRWKEKRNEMNKSYENALGYINGNDARMKQLLDVASRFPHQKLKNIVLIWAKKPDALHVRPKYIWKKLGAKLPGPDKAIWLFEDGKPWSDPSTGREGRYQDPKECYDVGDVGGVNVRTDETVAEPNKVLEAVFAAMRPTETEGTSVRRVNFRFDPQLVQTAQYDPSTDTVIVRRNAAPLERCQGVLQELCHRERVMREREGSRRTMADSFIAYAATYVICRQTGLSVEDFEFPPESFTAQDGKSFARQLYDIMDTAKALSEPVKAELVKLPFKEMEPPAPGLGREEG